MAAVAAPPAAAAGPAGAAETVLVEEASGVLPDRAIQLQPGVTYGQSKIGAERRDTWAPSLTVRAGLPWGIQAELHVPYVFAQQGQRKPVSGIDDVQLGLGKKLIAEGPYWPQVAAGVRWSSPTGDKTTRPPIGAGVDMLTGSVGAITRQAPWALFATLDYAAGLEQRSGARPRHAGGKIGAALGLSPETAVFADIGATSPALGFVRPAGVAQLGVITALSPTSALRIAIGAGVTRRAPRLLLTVSLPIAL